MATEYGIDMARIAPILQQKKRDEAQQEYQNKEVQLQLIGYIDGQEVINEYYLVGADCCHVYPISGNYNIIIE